MVHLASRRVRLYLVTQILSILVGVLGAWSLSVVGASADGPHVQRLDTDVGVGINMHPLQESYRVIPVARQLDAVTQLGASMVRIDIDWAMLERDSPGRAAWDRDATGRLNGFLDEATRRRISVVATVLATPCWASSDPERECTGSSRHYDQRYPPRSPDAYASFARELVQFAHGRIQIWEVWNEPNIAQFWISPDPLAYTALLRAAYTAIKGADPAATVLGGSLAVQNPAPGHIDTLEFADALYRAGADSFFDRLSYHPYTDGLPPAWYDARWPMSSFTRSIEALREMQLRYGDTRPIWLTESGWTTITGRCDDCFSPRLAVSEQAQGDALIHAIQTARGWDFVEAYLAYELIDRARGATTSYEDHFGLFRQDMTPKVGALQLKSLIGSSESDPTRMLTAVP